MRMIKKLELYFVIINSCDNLIHFSYNLAGMFSVTFSNA